MIYFAVALLIVAVALLILGLAERRSGSSRRPLSVPVAIVAVVVAVATMIQIYRVGDTGAQSVWGNEITHLKQANSK